MSLDNTLRNFDQAFNLLGRSGLNLAFPKEFELYVCAFELIDADGETLDYFIFPIMPSAINETIPQLHNIKKTDGGLSVLSTTGYIPTSIVISGNFGRSFKFLMGGGDLLSTFTKTKASGSIGFSSKSPIQTIKEQFNKRIKTGYACTKILENIIETASKLDERGRGYTLVFHNLAFDKVQIVKPQSLSITQDQQTNMIWNYNLQMDTLGDARKYFEVPDGIKGLKGTAFAQKAVGNVIDKVTTLFNKATSNLIK